MKLVHGWIGGLMAALLALMGLRLTDLYWGLDCPYMRTLLADPGDRFVLGGLLVLVAVLYVLSAWAARSAAPFLSFANEGGTVRISLRAVNDFLARLGDEFPAVVRLRADVAPRGETVEVRLNMSVKAGAQVQDLSQALQQRVREVLRERLGVTGVKSVHVDVREILSPEKPAGKEAGDQRAEWQTVAL